MIGTAPQVLAIQKVHSIQRSNGALVMAFESGLVAHLPPGHSDRDAMLREAESSLREHRPVGVMVDAEGSLVELTHAHDTSVDSVREDEEDPTRLAVWFWGYSPICYLTREHAEFERIRTTLEQAATSGNRVWLANRMHLVNGQTEVWWKILDAGSSEPLPSQP